MINVIGVNFDLQKSTVNNIEKITHFYQIKTLSFTCDR